ncbi:MAG TPA: ATP-dependent RecD-like DNA helicase [Spirochaetia bacterium]|nr:ATP-dependent RecD-like DNA helicase [Spirochaetia bacterium]
MDAQRDLFETPELVTIEGMLEKVRFSSEDDDWSVVAVSVSDTGREITAVGNLAGVQPGESLRLTGRWTRHPKFGPQLKVESFSVVPPVTGPGIERLLSSGLIEGIGRELASRLVAKFGDRTLEVIEKEPTRLRDVEGVGPQRARRLVEAWGRRRELREIVSLLQTCGVTTGLATRIFRQYGAGAHEVVRRNPWRLAAEMPGVGFRTADALARNLGVPSDSPQRIDAGILHALEERAEEGDVMAPRGKIVEESAMILGLPEAACEAAVTELSRRGVIVLEEDRDAGPLVGLPRLVSAEAGAARLLKEIAATSASGNRPGRPVEEEVAAFERTSGMTLSELQREAVSRADRDKVLVITGGPGTGKTTLVRAIIHVMQARGASLLLCAPTGRAAKRLSEASGREAKTIHRLLEYSPQQGRFLRNRENPLGCRALIVDEASMIDIVLFNRLLEAVPPAAALILVGDGDQLPSVGPGSVLADLIACGCLPVVRLRDIFRQASASSIVVNAHRINAGILPVLAATEERSDFYVIERSEPEAILETIRQLMSVRIPRSFGLDPRRDVQVLTPMRRGVLGSANLNRELQALLNPEGPSLTRGALVLRAGDRVMQTVNNYELGVFNGDIGSVERASDAEKAVTVRFDEREVRYEWSDLDELVPAYACSIHKGQGSEFPAVVIALHTQHYVLLKRNLLYTAVTRARKLAIVVGSRKALAIAVHTTGSEERCTRLAPRLRDIMGAA